MMEAQDHNWLFAARSGGRPAAAPPANSRTAETHDEGPLKLLTTSTDHYLVHTLVADAVLAKALLSAQRGRVEIITIPTVHDGAASTAQILVNESTQLSVRDAGTSDDALSVADLAALAVLTESLPVLVEGEAVDAADAFVDFALYAGPRTP